MPGILAIDIGGSGLKASVLKDDGTMMVERVRVDTPSPCPPGVMVAALATLVEPLPAFDRISVGFPGVVREGKVLTAPNLGTDDWHGFDLAGALAAQWDGKPVKIVNDADMQGLAVAAGKGVELVITLGTGVGTAFFRDGILLPHLELAHHPVHKSKTYDEFLGDEARDAVGNKRWNKRLQRVIPILQTVFNFDHLYIGGGNSEHVRIALPEEVSLISNDEGIHGGAKLWTGRLAKGTSRSGGSRAGRAVMSDASAADTPV